MRNFRLLTHFQQEYFFLKCVLFSYDVIVSLFKLIVFVQSGQSNWQRFAGYRISIIRTMSSNKYWFVVQLIFSMHLFQIYLSSDKSTKLNKKIRIKRIHKERETIRNSLSHHRCQIIWKLGLTNIMHTHTLTVRRV